VSRRILAALGLEARAINNPRVSMNSQEFWDALGGGSRSAAGVTVNRETAFSVSAWWRGIILRANAVAKIASPRVLKRQGAGFVVDPTHPGHIALRQFKHATPFLFFQTLSGHKLTTGNGYAYIVRNGAGEPVELSLMDPTRVTPFRENGRLLYLYESDKGPVRLREDEVLHSRGYGWDGLCGYSVVEKAKETLGASVAMREHGARFFAQGARLGVLLEHPSNMSKEAQDRFLASWRKSREGVENAWKTVILEEGMKASSPLQMSADDAQLIESRAFETREIANFLGVPPHKLGDVATKTYASVEQEEQAFVNDTVDPDLVEMEQALEAQLLTEEQKRSGDWIVRFDRSGLVRADTDSRNAAHQTALAGMPYRTINEVRADEGLNPLPGYDDLHIPINLQQPDAPDPAHEGGDDPEEPEEMPPPPPPESPPPEADGVDAERVLQAVVEAINGQRPRETRKPTTPTPDVDAARKARGFDAALVASRTRMVRRLASAARSAGKDPSKFTAWLDGVREVHEPVVREAFAFADGVSDTRAEVDALFAGLRSACDRAQEAKVSEFPAALESALVEWEGAR